MPTDAEGFATLDALTTDELREQAFTKAEHAHDVGFFWDLIKHLGASEAMGSDDGSAGGLGEGIGGAIGIVRELLGRHEESAEPMLRARYIDYLQQSGD
jgi:hypothetical protein